MRYGLLALALALPFVSLGCGTPKSTGASPTAPARRAEAGAPASESAAGAESGGMVTNAKPTTKKELTIGVAMTWGHPYWQNMITGFEEEAKAQEAARGITVKLVFQNAEEDAAKQVAQCQDLVAQAVDAVIMVPVQREASVRGVWLLNEAGIPVILVNRTISDSTGKARWVCYTGTDTYEGALVSAELLAKALDGKGRIAELQQVLGSDPQLARTKALDDVLARHPELERISQQPFGADEAKAVSLCQDLLGANPDLVGIYAHGDNAAMYALKAAEAAGRKDLKVVGMGGNKEALQAVREGRLLGTSYQQPHEEGCMGMRAALAWLHGEPVKVFDPTPVLPVTRDNADEFEGQF